MKHLKTITEIEKLIKLKRETSDTLKELRDTISKNGCDYILLKVHGSMFQYQLHDKKTGECVVGGYEITIKNYVRYHMIDIEKIFGKELIFGPDTDNQNIYDSTIKQNKEVIQTLIELSETLLKNDCDYILSKDQDSMFKFILNDNKTGECVVGGSETVIKNYVLYHNIDTNTIFGKQLIFK